MGDDFRDYARLPAPVFVAFDLNGLVLEVLSLYEGAGLAPVRQLEAGLPDVHADPSQIRQVIHNLVQNAQDALAGRPDPRIEIRTGVAGVQVRYGQGYAYLDGGDYEAIRLCREIANKRSAYLSPRRSKTAGKVIYLGNDGYSQNGALDAGTT